MAIFKFLSHLKFLIIGLLLGSIGFWAFNTYYIAQKLMSLEELFKENTEYKFHHYATKIMGKQRLQVAMLQQMEVFERTSQLKTLGIHLPDVVVKATLPVEYGFFVNMTSGWKFSNNAEEILVDVPELTNGKPAVDVGQLRYEIVKGSLLRSENESLLKLKQELMGLLTERSIAHRDLVKEQARASIEQFVRGWLKETTGAQIDKPLRIRFPDEVNKKTPAFP